MGRTIRGESDKAWDPIHRCLTDGSLHFPERGGDQIDANDYEFELGDEDFTYMWDSFLVVRRFFKKTAQSGRAVIFTVDA